MRKIKVIFLVMTAFGCNSENDDESTTNSQDTLNIETKVDATKNTSNTAVDFGCDGWNKDHISVPGQHALRGWHTEGNVAYWKPQGNQPAVDLRNKMLGPKSFCILSTYTNNALPRNDHTILIPSDVTKSRNSKMWQDINLPNPTHGFNYLKINAEFFYEIDPNPYFQDTFEIEVVGKDFPFFKKISGSIQEHAPKQEFCFDFSDNIYSQRKAQVSLAVNAGDKLFDSTLAIDSVSFSNIPCER